ncbi:MAG: GGDEF domain-containing protein [Dehalococcoidia bacterium]|nr:GGDEF domain-containing protein [Dehalococcoidia bacterium]
MNRVQSLGRSMSRYLETGTPAHLGVPTLTRRRIALLFGLFLAFTEVIVLTRLAFLIGAAMILSTAGLALVFRNTIVEKLRAAASAPTVEAARDTLYFDPETRLPNRPHLIDELPREIARSRRYNQPLSLAIIQLTRYPDFRASWGAETTRQAILHVAETIRRVGRASDFAARIDESRFAVLLTQCTEDDASTFGDRLSLAASNRPIRSVAQVKVPLYVGIDVRATEYSAERFRGPLDFLSAAGGDLVAEGDPPAPVLDRPRSLATNPQALRRQLIRDYYPEGQIIDFADAYRAHRSSARRVS